MLPSQGSCDTINTKIVHHLVRQWKNAASEARRSSPTCSSSNRASAVRHALPQELSTNISPSQSGSRVSFEVDASYVACSNFLRSLGLENRAEIARVLDIATNPNSLFHTYRDKKRDNNPLARKLDAELDLKPLVEFLLSQGLNKEELIKIIVAHPAVLCYCPEKRLKPLFEYITNLGIQNPEQVIVARPSLLGLDVDKNLRQIVVYLQENGYTPQQIEHLLVTSL